MLLHVLQLTVTVSYSLLRVSTPSSTSFKRGRSDSFGNTRLHWCMRNLAVNDERRPEEKVTGEGVAACAEDRSSIDHRAQTTVHSRITAGNPESQLTRAAAHKLLRPVIAAGPSCRRATAVATAPPIEDRHVEVVRGRPSAAVMSRDLSLLSLF